MIDGPKITIGDREFVVPPANLKAIRAFTSVRENADATSTDRQNANIAFILNTLRRNYPDLTEDFILEHVDTRNQVAVMTKIQESAGFVKQEPVSGESTAETA
jgi:hypothetical protein